MLMRSAKYLWSTERWRRAGLGFVGDESNATKHLFTGKEEKLIHNNDNKGTKYRVLPLGLPNAQELRGGEDSLQLG